MAAETSTTDGAASHTMASAVASTKDF